MSSDSADLVNFVDISDEARSDSSWKESQQTKDEFDSRQQSPHSNRVGQPTPSTNEKDVPPQQSICFLGGSLAISSDHSQESQCRIGGEIARIIKKTESNHPGRDKKGSHQATCTRDHLPHLKQPMGKSDSSST
ncbi:hypothetical protein CR513_18863, partial [Mucuna pruriens]